MKLAADLGSTVKLVVGLGNPGPRYERTRHNAGFLVIDALASKYGGALRQQREAASCKLPATVLGPAAVTLLKPLTFMNLSGKAVQAAMTREGVRPGEVLVVHDDIDLPLGRLRLRKGGSGGGQRGVVDIARAVGPDFIRLKVGVGRPPENYSTENWVLSRFSDSESELLAAIVGHATEAVELVCKTGLEAAMNSVNALNLVPQD